MIKSFLWCLSMQKQIEKRHFPPSFTANISQPDPTMFPSSIVNLDASSPFSAQISVKRVLVNVFVQQNLLQHVRNQGSSLKKKTNPSQFNEFVANF